MYLEYIVGPVIALLLGMKFTDYKTKEQVARIESVELQVKQNTDNLPKQVLAMQVPVAKAIKALNEQVGLQWGR